MTVLNRQRGTRIDCRELHRFLERLSDELPAGGSDSLAVCLVSDRKMREYNRRFRRREGATDVLSFPAVPPAGTDAERHLGDIVIAVPTATRQAARARHSVDRELKVLALHGYLHLLGYDHETDDGEMLAVQERLARRLLPSASCGGAA